MAFGIGSAAGTANSTVNDQASLALTTTGLISVGELAVLSVAVDNNQGADIDEGAVSSVTDTGGNLWVKALELANGQGGAQLGSVCSVWYSVITVQLNIGATITINFSNATSRDAAAAVVRRFTRDTALSIVIRGTSSVADDGVDASSLDVTTPNSEHLRVRATASESNATGYTATASWTNSASDRAVADKGSATPSQRIAGEYRIVTATNAASQPLVDTGDKASVYVAFAEVALARQKSQMVV